MSHILGIDIGGTTTVFGLIDPNGKVHGKNKIPTQGSEPAENLIQRIFYEVHAVLNHQPDISLTGIGVGAPNGNHFTGFIQDPPNINWGSVDFVSLMEGKFGIKVLLTNDANAAALGEKLYGAAKSMDDFIMVTLGTGLGSGIFSQSKLLYGHDGIAGELGHMSIDPNGRECSCGQKGCLETYVSANGIKETLKELKTKYPDDEFLKSVVENTLDGKQLDMAYDEGERAVHEIYEFTGEKLGYGLAQTAGLFSPEAFIFYGGYSYAEERLFNPARKVMDEHLSPSQKGKIKLFRSKLSDGDAGILGAASLFSIK